MSKVIHKHRTFKNENVVLDDVEFENCTFTNCTFLYSGTGEHRLVNGVFLGTSRLFMNGPAANTMDLLRNLHAAGGQLRGIVDSCIDAIKGEADSAQAQFEVRSKS